MIEILLVDDESYVTESIVHSIPWSELGVDHVYQANSAMQALQILEEHSIDIVVTDIRMPTMNGLQLIEIIGDRWPNIRNILLTGHSDFEYAKKAIQLHASDYILKPVNDGEFLLSISNVIESLKDEWGQSERYQQLLYHMKSDVSVLKANLMHELLLGRRQSHKSIQDKLIQYDIHLKVEDPAVMMLIQLGKQFSEFDHHSVSLIEFAVGNIAEDVFTEDFHVWSCKAPHDCLILLAALKPDYHHRIQMAKDYEKQRKSKLDALVHVFQRSVSNYLKGDISIMITGWFQFPDGISTAYRTGLSAFYLVEQKTTTTVQYLEELSYGKNPSVKSIESLYKPPTFIHLLESKQWEVAAQKINDVITDLEHTSFSREHIYEVYLSVTNAFMYIAHKQGLFMHQVDQGGVDLFLDQSVIHSLEKLKGWSMGLLNKLKSELSDNDHHTRSYLIKQIQEIVANELGQDISVKTIADRVYLHPVYLSKIYKMEMGESLGDYIIRMRMERALYYLKNTNKKIYEITMELGYQNPQYFSKMFKKHHGMTPIEFRDQ
jgi:two-component system response regulator YesN